MRAKPALGAKAEKKIDLGNPVRNGEVNKSMGDTPQ